MGSAGSRAAQGETNAGATGAATAAPATDGGAVAAAPAPEVELPAQEDMKIDSRTITDFELMTTLGKGSFGRVRLARHVASQTLWAVKILKKKDVLANNALDHVYREKQVLSQLRHPFIVHMPAAFDDERHVFIVLEFVQGGPFDTRLRGEGHLAAQEASFYAAQIVHIFEYMHSKQYIYRDLKPDNLIIDMVGYIKLADFGFAKQCTGQSTTVCGTPDYMAPEIIRKEPYGPAVDWWALGIVLCEMLTGTTPFAAETHEETYKNILKGKPKFGTNSDLESNQRGIIKRFLAVNPGDRLGTAKLGVNEIKKHKFFKAIDWLALLRKELVAPYDPFVNFPEDTSNFDEYPDSKQPTDKPDYAGGADPFRDFNTSAVPKPAQILGAPATTSTPEDAPAPLS